MPLSYDTIWGKNISDVGINNYSMLKKKYTKPLLIQFMSYLSFNYTTVITGLGRVL